MKSSIVTAAKTSRQRGMDRRAALQHLGAGALLALGLWPGTLRAEDGDTAEAFRFLVVNDLHHPGPDGSAWLEGLVRQMKAHPQTEFCLLAGDLVETGGQEDLAAVRDAFKALGISIYVVIGNHDYLRQNDRRAYEALFPDRLNYWFKHRVWQFVGVDTTDGVRYERTSIQQPTFRWLDDHLGELEPKLPTVIFTHFPLGSNVHYRPANADALLERFKSVNLRAVFSGHWHGFTERRMGAITLTTDRCCALKRANHDGTKEKGYFLCTASQGEITRQFVEFKG